MACGLCLAHCPTYRVTGEEGLSPRGRIAAMRAVDAGAPIDDTFERLMQTCVQCRACETACPSSVPFGRLMEGTREMLAPPTRCRGGSGPPTGCSATTGPWWRSRPWGPSPSGPGWCPGRSARRLALPRLPVRQAPLVATGADVWLFTGCVMDAWQRHVHRAAIAVLGACGAGVALPGPGAACCGALHVHAGLRDRRRPAWPGGSWRPSPARRPILVDSAGCGAALKDYGHLLGTAEAGVSPPGCRHPRVAGGPGSTGCPPPASRRTRPGLRDRGAGSCHLRHVQHARGPRPHRARAATGRSSSSTDEGRCCGAGGAYSALQPELAGQIRTQKVAVIAAAGADVVASANPGCGLWLAGAGVPVRHPLEIVAAAAGLEVDDGR